MQYIYIILIQVRNDYLSKNFDSLDLETAIQLCCIEIRRFFKVRELSLSFYLSFSLSLTLAVSFSLILSPTETNLRVWYTLFLYIYPRTHVLLFYISYIVIFLLYHWYMVMIIFGFELINNFFSLSST